MWFDGAWRLNRAIKLLIRSDPRCYVPEGEDLTNPTIIHGHLGPITDILE
jgi:hypothetical protein